MKNNTFSIVFGSQSLIAWNFISLSLKCYFTTYEALSISGRKSTSYFSSARHFRETVLLILIIISGGRNYYPHFIEEETESQRSKMICRTQGAQKQGLEPGSDTKHCLTFHLYCLEEEKEMGLVKQNWMGHLKGCTAKF